MDGPLDNFPTISVGVKYGKYLSNFEPNLAFITQQMRSAGLSEEEISKTRIIFTDEPYPIESQGTYVGRYSRINNLVQVFGFEEVQNAAHGLPPKYGKAEEFISEILVHELEHRISASDPEQRKINWRYHNKLLTSKRSFVIVLGGVALTLSLAAADTQILHAELSTSKMVLFAIFSYLVGRKAEQVFFSEQIYNEYENSPEELRVRAIAAQHKDKVIITFRSTEASQDQT